MLSEVQPMTKKPSCFEPVARQCTIAHTCARLLKSQAKEQKEVRMGAWFPEPLYEQCLMA